jgi:hypothetical protein
MKTFRILSGILVTSLAAPLAVLGDDAPAATPPPAAAAPAPPPASSSSSIVTLTAAKTDEVVNPLDCDHLLTVAGRDLNRVDPAFAASLQSSVNPYFLKLPPPPPEVVPSSTGSTPEPVTKLTDAEKLAQLADALQASGTMGKNGVLLLVFENRPSLRVGQIIDVTFPGEDGPTHILLSRITEKSYTLKLNDTVLPVPLHPPSSAEPASHNGAAKSPPASKP